MKQRIFSAILLTALAHSSAWAEIYETTDSEGNKVFSDTPTSDAKVVDVQEATIADAVEPGPEPTPAPQPAGGGQAAGNSQGAQSQDDGVYIIGDSRNERLEEEIARERRHEVLEGEKPKEVLEADHTGAVERVEHGAPLPQPQPHRAPHVHRR